MGFNNICSNKTSSTSLFICLLWLCYAINYGFSIGVPVTNLAVNDCPQHIYRIPTYTYKIHKIIYYLFIIIYGDRNQVTTEALYYVRNIGNKHLVVGVCYRFGGSHFNVPRPNVSVAVRNSIQKACIVGPCHSGHLIPSNMGGPDEPKNIIPQFDKLNTGTWRRFEQICQKS